MSNQKTFFIFTMSALVVFGCSKSTPENGNARSIPTEAAVPLAQSQNTQPKQTIELIDVQIHDYTQQVGEEYTSQFGIKKGEALAAIAASKKFNMTILDVSRAHDLIEDKKAGWNISPVELDQMNIKRFRDIGFVEKMGFGILKVRWSIWGNHYHLNPFVRHTAWITGTNGLIGNYLVLTALRYALAREIPFGKARFQA